MSLIEIVLLGFILFELSNVAMLYFLPGSTMGNAAGVFTAWEKSKQDPEIHNLVRYLVYWVAGTKLIFIFLLVVIIFLGSPEIQRISTLALMISIATFYWRLFPLIRKMDHAGQITPKNYSTTLGIMISVILVALAIVVAVAFLQ